MAILESLAAGYLIGKAAVLAYNALFTPVQRKQLENKVKTHHFEYGVATTAAGVLTKSPTAVGTGISLIADDWKDKDVAIQNMKNKVNTVINNLQKAFQPSNTNQYNHFIHNPRLRQMYRGKQINLNNYRL